MRSRLPERIRSTWRALGLDLAVVDDVDAVHTAAAREGIEVISAPEDKPWDVRKMHVRHPDGHILSVSSEATHEHR
jgi:uncharacterized glyoxalase superfamily protein PhnB